ncbi:MAG: NADH-quinone oxidoreductase subunit N [Pedosphaera sp.]|nr:NADH-quinone oxidoreductase subunit N [Pedosphaera sp.]
MNLQLITLEVVVTLIGVTILLGSLWLPAAKRLHLPLITSAILVVLLLAHCFVMDVDTTTTLHGFNGGIVQDGFAICLKRLFLITAAFVLAMSAPFAERLRAGPGEFCALVLFALVGMLFAASANDFVMLFVAVELITVTFYILTSFQRHEERSLEAGVKFLILGGVATGLMVFGISMIFAGTGTMSLREISKLDTLPNLMLFRAGLLLVVAGLGFKIAIVPFQLWAPDVYQGAPTPVTAFLAVGSKMAGFALLMRLLRHTSRPETGFLLDALAALAAFSMIYGSLCAIWQRQLKRLMAYIGIASAGYLLIGVIAMAKGFDGTKALLFYLVSYLFAAMAAFTVIGLISKEGVDERLEILTGLHRRSPGLALILTLAIVSLAGIPPLAGFFGKFLLLQLLVEMGVNNAAYYWLLGIALACIVASLGFFFGIIRAIYWPDATVAAGEDSSPIPTSLPLKIALTLSAAGFVLLGLQPDLFLDLIQETVRAFRWQ